MARTRASLKLLIVYGPTQEPLDPVRYLSNRSTGTMGRHLIEAAKRAGFGVTSVECPRDARTARDLLTLLKRRIAAHDVLIMAAAVCDVRPAGVSQAKLKKTSLNSLKLVRNPDILATLARQKTPEQIFIGFGIETRDLMRNGRAKLAAKKLNAIVLQKVSDRTDPFGERKIQSTILGTKGIISTYKRISKSDLAREIMNKLRDGSLGFC